MNYRFASFETAAVFVSIKRDQGYFAEILHLNVGHLWGPLATGGFSVVVSEFAAEEDEEIPDLPLKVFSLPQELSGIVAYVTIAGLAIFSLLLLYELLNFAAIHPQESLIGAIWIVLRGYVLSVFLGGFGLLLSEITGIFRNKDHPRHRLVRVLHGILALLLIF